MATMRSRILLVIQNPDEIGSLPKVVCGDAIPNSPGPDDAKCLRPPSEQAKAKGGTSGSQPPKSREGGSNTPGS